MKWHPLTAFVWSFSFFNLFKVKLLSPTLCDPRDCSLPGSPVHGIFQARVLEWLAIPFARGIFLTQGSNLGLPHCGQMLYHLSHQGSPDLFNWRIITELWWFLPYPDMYQPLVHMCAPHLEPPPTSVPTSSPRVSQSTGFDALLHASNLHWSSIFHTIIYMFQRYSLKSSHTCLFSQSPRVCSLHLCLFCCLAYKVVVTSSLLSSFFSSCLKFVNNLVAGVPLVSHLGDEVQPGGPACPAPPLPPPTLSRSSPPPGL